MTRAIAPRVAVALLLALGGCAPAESSAADPPAVLAQRITLGADAAAAHDLGALRLEAAFALGSSDPRFGGLSGLWLAPDGGALIAASDRGTLWRASLAHHADGGLAGFADWQAVEPGRAPGDPTGRAGRDMEALASDDAGGLVIAYEGRHRLRRVALATLDGEARGFPALPGLERPSNAGIEAMTPIEGGALLTLAEGLHDADGDLAAWYVTDEQALRLSYVASEGFVPTGADRLDGIVYVVERRFSLLGGFVSRIVSFPAADVHPGARLIPQTLALLRPPLVGENFEGIAARRAPDGRTLLYVVSDDNFTPLQRTLVLQLSVPREQAVPSG